MKYLLLFWLLCCSVITLAQINNPWAELADVQIMTRLGEDSPFPVQYPVFGPNAMALDGKTITIKGYMVPLEEMMGQNYFVLSSLPFNLCYFCGGAGPETVMEVFTKKELEFDSDLITLQGKLYLNPDDPNRLMYILEEAIRIDD
ncbi:MAG TPA: hypothetical protein DCE41_28945 [Cytophagales bacterium]|nr:hypothetical protein [Cytophagales bacterium]HAA19732.1 hypothetical protein [Cytophagales bacterium]HAP61606.1 hypothetical protein [Cytophagales bacterium]